MYFVHTDVKHSFAFLFLLQLQNDVLNLYVKLKTFQIIYNHCEIYDWVHNNFLSRKRQKQQPPLLLQQKSLPDHLGSLQSAWQSSRQSDRAGDNDNGLFEWIMEHIVVKGCAELWNVSMLMKLDDDEHAGMSVSHTRLVLEQIEEKRSSMYKTKIFNLLLNQRHWNVELMIESLWWSLGNSINDTNNLKKSHSPGSPFFIGVSLVKLSSYSNATKLEVSVHTLRTEYSMTLSKFVIKTVNCIKQYGGLKAEGTRSAKPALTPKPIELGVCLLVSAKVKDITAYFVNHHKACVLLSFSEITLTRSHQLSHLKLEEFQMAIMRSMTSSSLCLNDFTDIFANCKLIRLEYESQEQKRPKLSMYIPGNTEAIWNSNLHMHVLTLARDMQDLKTALALPQKYKPPSSKSNEANANTNKLIVELSAERSTVFEIKLSDRHSMQWFVENLFFSHKDGNFISAENVFIKIDDEHIFTLKDVDIHSLAKLDMLTRERSTYMSFVLPTNKVWVTTIGTFKVNIIKINVAFILK